MRKLGTFLICYTLCGLSFSNLSFSNLSFAAGHPSAPTPEDDEFHFVVLGDAQFHDPHTFNRLIDQVRRLRPAFVLQVGDLIQGYNSDLTEVSAQWQRFIKQVAPLAPISYLPVPGNHDLYNADRVPDQQLETLFEQHWGPLYFAFEYKNTLIVGLNSDGTEGQNRIVGKQWQWLVKTLSSSDAKHKMVFLHRPPLQMDNADDLHNLFKKQSVSQVFYGHHHHYHHFVKDHINYTMTNAAANSTHRNAKIGGMPHLLQVSVRGDEVVVAVIAADSIAAANSVVPEDNYDFFALTQALLPKQVTLNKTQAGKFDLVIPINNTSQRTVQLFVNCDSADERWLFEPPALQPVSLAAKQKSSLRLSTHFRPDRAPESTPRCHVRVPFQTAHGEWIDFELTVTTQQP